MSFISETKDLYKGETCFVIGCGPQLADLTKKHIEIISNSISIGCNASIYLLPTTYWVSSYILWCNIARNRFTMRTNSIHFQNPRDNYTFNEEWIETVPYDKWPWIIDKELLIKHHLKRGMAYRTAAMKQIQFAAHLGCSKIVCIGVEMKTEDHFYTKFPEICEKLHSDFELVKHNTGITDERRERFEQYTLGDKTKPKPAFPNTIKITNEFAYMDEILKRNGVELSCTSKNSFMIDAGIKYIPLNDIHNYRTLLGNKTLTISKIANGGRCFILGCGPQLSEIDKNILDKLKQETTIGTNTSHYKFWPSIWVGLHPGQLYMYYRHKRRCLDSGEDIKTRGILFTCFPPVKVESDVTILPHFHTIFNLDRVEYHQPYPYNTLKNFTNRRIYHSFSIVVEAIQLAVLLGFDEIYLIGVQMNVLDHFYTRLPEIYDEIVEDARSFGMESPPFTRKEIECNFLTKSLMQPYKEQPFFDKNMLDQKKIVMDHYKWLKRDFSDIKIFNTSTDSVLQDIFEFKDFGDIRWKKR